MKSEKDLEKIAERLMADGDQEKWEKGELGDSEPHAVVHQPLKRSAGDDLQTEHGDWLLAKCGIKTATSRYGDRMSEYPLGKSLNLRSNDTCESLQITVEEVEVKRLEDITTGDAKAIGNYTVEDHAKDFTGIYQGRLGREVTPRTVVTVIHFRLR